MRRAALTSLTHMSLNDVLANDESYQKVWPFLERGIVDALSEQQDPVLQVSLCSTGSGTASAKVLICQSSLAQEG